MRIIISFLLFLSICFQGYSQKISIKSFRLLENDLDAKQNFPERDQNGNLCAIIKIVTTETGFDFDNGTLGITKVVPKSAEIWLYVPYGTKRISIAHPKLGMIRDYIINIPIQQGRCYELTLITGKIVTIVEEELTNQYVTINSEPSNAIVFIDDEQQTQLTPFSKKLPLGKHSYRIELADYENEAGVFVINSDKKTELKLKLKPLFGLLNISTSPENGAKIFIDNKPQNGETPLNSIPVLFGKHTIKIIKPFFFPVEQTVEILSNETKKLNITMIANFATVNVKTNPKSNIYVDGTKLAFDSLITKLEPGIHIVEANLECHYSDKTTINVETGQFLSFNLQPKPKYGNLDINTQPSDVQILINGKNYGTSPLLINNLLIGQYKVIYNKIGYATLTKYIQISEGNTLEINQVMNAGALVKISTIPKGAEIWIDGDSLGITPFSEFLKLGNQNIQLKIGKKSIKQNISVSDKSNVFSFDLREGTIVDIISNPSNAKLFIDDSLIFKTPFHEFLSFGKHKVKITSNDIIKEKNIVIDKTSDNYFAFDLNKYLKDIDGNTYKTVIIGEQEWMTENLKTTRFNDGNSIPNITDELAWDIDSLNTPAYCWYNNNQTYKAIYGALYNQYCVATKKLCPIGWHVPNYEEWKELESFIETHSTIKDDKTRYNSNSENDWHYSNSGGALKEIGTNHWKNPNTDATNIYGFTALPGGRRNIRGQYNSMGEMGYWWTSSYLDKLFGCLRKISFDDNQISRWNDWKSLGCSVRCIKDK